MAIIPMIRYPIKKGFIEKARVGEWINPTKAMAELKGTEVFAVRSSSPEEDLVGTSFAGMYETYLGTTGNQLEETIARAYSSMFDYRVMEYKTQNDITLEGTCISVIVQKQIASDVSGVGFSLNPMNNCYDEVMINASFGLGEAIVSGIVTPDTYIVDIEPWRR